jgi:hypothetical protein
MARLSATIGEGSISHQGVVKGNDHSPIRLLSAMRVYPCDRGFHMMFGQLRTRCLEIEEPLSFGHELGIQPGSILVEARAQVSRSIDVPRQACAVETHRASSGNRGWQQENIMRSRSSWMAFDPKSSSTSGASVHALHTGCPSFGPEPECSTFPRQEIERPVLGGRHKPRRRVFRHATKAPHLQRPAEGVLYDVLRQGEVVDSEDPGQHGDHASCFAPKKMIARLDHMLIFMIGRTSTAPSTSKIGQPFESSTACSKSRASISV